MRGRLTVRLKRLTEDEIHKWSRSRNGFLSSSKDETLIKTSKVEKKTRPNVDSKNSSKPIVSVECCLESTNNVLQTGAFSSECNVMEGALLEEIDIDTEPIKIKEEEESAEEVEILDLFEHTFLCTICGRTHSKNLSCVDYGILKSEVFPCSNQECGQIFDSELELEQHADSCQVTDPLFIDIATFQEEDDYYLLRPKLKWCKDCQKKFKAKYLYLRHMRISHPELINCRLFGCHKFFRKKADFEQHWLKSHKNAVSCAICGKEYGSKESVRVHLLYKHLQHRPMKKRSVAGKTKCPHCCNFYINLKRHTKFCHPDKLLKCLQPSCRWEFVSDAEVQAHVQKKHTIFSCDVCHEYFSSEPRLESHFFKQHQQQKNKMADSSHLEKDVPTLQLDKLLKCPKSSCIKRQFTTEISLRDHLQSFHGAISCIHCDQVFEKKDWYIIHVFREHSDKGCFKCSYKWCILFFKSRPEMEQHFAEYHQFYAKCDFCDYLAPTLDSISNHTLKRHGQIFVPSTKKSMAEN